MKKYTRSLLRKLEKSKDPRLALVRKYLDKYGIRVGEWLPYDNKGAWTTYTYHADFETHRVFIPVPVDNYSLYVCLHEIGHLASGESMYAYLQEWDAEQWALDRCRQHGYYRKTYETGAKQYVLRNMYEDICFRQLSPKKVPLQIMQWLGKDSDSIRRGAVRWLNNWMKGDQDTISFYDDAEIFPITAADI